MAASAARGVHKISLQGRFHSRLNDPDGEPESRARGGATPRRPSSCSCARTTSSRPARCRRARARPAPRRRVRPATRVVANPRKTARAHARKSSQGRRHQRAPQHEDAATNGAGSRQHGDRRLRAHASPPQFPRGSVAPGDDGLRGPVRFVVGWDPLLRGYHPDLVEPCKLRITSRDHTSRAA
jgi:hypothetical protein